MQDNRPLRILMMIHRQADKSAYCQYVHEQAKALRDRGHDVVVIACVGVTPMMERLRPEQAAVAEATPGAAVVDGIEVYYPRALTLGNAGERLFGGRLIYMAAVGLAKKLHAEKQRRILVMLAAPPGQGKAHWLASWKNLQRMSARGKRFRP